MRHSRKPGLPEEQEMLQLDPSELGNGAPFVVENEVIDKHASTVNDLELKDVLCQSRGANGL